jgi:1-deoxy-D-xylulose-5-phosphate reductoisomerase
MRTPIAYALGWPKRIDAPSARLDFAKIAQLTFEAPDSERFPALRIAREALQRGGRAPTILNAANEISVAAFLEGEIRFTDIARVVETVIERIPGGELAGIADVLETDREARRLAREEVTARKRNLVN